MLDVSGWFVIGFIILCILTYQDIKNKMKVDGRRNYYAAGFTLAFLLSRNHGFWMIISIFIISMLLGTYIKKTKALGSADASSISWLLMGYAAIALYMLPVFFFVFIFIFLLWVATSRILFKVNSPLPFYPVLLICHGAMGIIYLFQS